MPDRSLYDNLGVQPDADHETIKKAYRALMMKHHPDVSDLPESPDIARAAAEAWEVLQDPEKRAVYDRGDPDPEEEPEPGPVVVDEWGTPTEWTEPEVPTEAARSTAVGGKARRVKALRPPRTRVRHPGSRLRWVGAAATAGLLVVLVLALVATPGPSFLTTPTLKAAVVGAGAVVGAVLAYQSRSTRVDAWPGGFFALAVCVALQVLVPPQWAGAARFGQALAITMAAVLVAVDCQTRQRRLNAIIPVSSLRKNNLFGSLPGGVAADLLNRDLLRFGNVPAARMLRSAASDTPFSHTVVVGDRVVLVGAVMGGPGLYRWSGPSLLREPEGSPYPVEVLRGNHEVVLRRAQSAAAKGVEVRAWLLVYGAGDGRVLERPSVQSPTVAAAEEGVQGIEEFLMGASAVHVVDQATVAAAAVALAG